MSRLHVVDNDEGWSSRAAKNRLEVSIFGELLLGL